MSVRGAYSMSSNTSVRSTTEPGLAARFSPAEEAAQSAREVAAAFVHDGVEHRRVRPGEVRWGERVEQVARGEARVALSTPVGGGVVDQLVERRAGGQIGLQYPVQQPVALPGR